MVGRSIQSEDVAFLLIIVGAHMNIIFNIKVNVAFSDRVMYTIGAPQFYRLLNQEE